MSSYLNAFVISDLASVDDGISKPGETTHHIWVRPDSIGKVGFALNHSIESLKALEEYTGFQYELTKVDSAGIPNKGGAMEVINALIIIRIEQIEQYDVCFTELGNDYLSRKCYDL